jgi:hypothetical protein
VGKGREGKERRGVEGEDCTTRPVMWVVRGCFLACLLWQPAFFLDTFVRAYYLHLTYGNATECKYFTALSVTNLFGKLDQKADFQSPRFLSLNTFSHRSIIVIEADFHLSELSLTS